MRFVVPTANDRDSARMAPSVFRRTPYAEQRAGECFFVKDDPCRKIQKSTALKDLIIGEIARKIVVVTTERK
eukprot:scaffold2765_cov165-Amphora_coffeaeformis.AAC.6